MTTDERAGFLAAILNDPDTDAHREAYADALRESDDAHDRAHGAFVWAGLTLARMAESGEPREGMWYDAIREQADSGRAVLGAQVGALLGWPMAQWSWDNDAQRPDRATAVLVPPPEEGETPSARRLRRRRVGRRPAVVWERGFVHEVRLTLNQWRLAAAKCVTHTPLRRAEAVDVPGLSFAVEGPQDGWRLRGEVALPRLPERVEMLPLRTTTHPAVPPLVVAERTVAFDRDGLVACLPRAVDDLVSALRHLAGERWPLPGPTA